MLFYFFMSCKNSSPLWGGGPRSGGGGCLAKRGLCRDVSSWVGCHSEAKPKNIVLLYWKEVPDLSGGGFLFLYFWGGFAPKPQHYWYSGASPRTPTHFCQPATKVGKNASRLTSQFQKISHFVSILVKFEAEPKLLKGLRSCSKVVCFFVCCVILTNWRYLMDGIFTRNYEFFPNYVIF